MTQIPVAGKVGNDEVQASVEVLESVAIVRVAVDGGGGGGMRGEKVIKGFGWKRSVPPQKWMKLSPKVLSPPEIRGAS